MITDDYWTQLIVGSFFIVFLPLFIMGFVSMWREHRDKKQAEQ